MRSEQAQSGDPLFPDYFQSSLDGIVRVLFCSGALRFFLGDTNLFITLFDGLVSARYIAEECCFPCVSFDVQLLWSAAQVEKNVDHECKTVKPERIPDEHPIYLSVRITKVGRAVEPMG